jgi:hypothetical protein
MYQVPKQNEWNMLRDLGVFNSSGDTLIDPDLAEDLSLDFGIEEHDVEEAVEEADLLHTEVDRVSFFIVEGRDAYERIREVLIDKFGVPEESEEDQ